MSQWSATKAKQVLKALKSIGWKIKRQTGSHKILGFFSLFYARDGGYKGCNPYIERHLAIFVNCFCLERTNQLSLFPDKDLVDLYPSYRTITSNEEPILERSGWNDVVFAFHDGDEIRPKMLARIAKLTGLTPDDL